MNMNQTSTNLVDWSVILNQTLQGSDWDKLLRPHGMKIRGSSSTTENSIIFPKSALAFLVLPLEKCTIGQFDVKPQVLQLLEKFTQVHARSYVLAIASLHGERELKVFSTIQSRFLQTKLQMIPIHNVDEGIEVMINIAKVLCKPMADTMYKRLQCLASDYSIDETVKNMLLQIGLTEHQAHILQDCLGSFSNIVRADKEELLDCSLDTETADKILTFFSTAKNNVFT